MNYFSISSNDNPNYLVYLALQIQINAVVNNCKSVVFTVGDESKIHKVLSLADKSNYIHKHIKSVEGYRDATLSQVSRLYAAMMPGLKPDDFIILGDIDMIVFNKTFMQDFNLDVLNVYGYNLVSSNQLPMQYTSAMVHIWQDLMRMEGNDGTIKDLEKLLITDIKTKLQPNEENFNSYWYVDQELVYERWTQSNIKANKIGRRSGRNGLCFGRIDRANWNQSFSEYNKPIDAHLLHGSHNEVVYNAIIDLDKKYFNSQFRDIIEKSFEAVN